MILYSHARYPLRRHFYDYVLHIRFAAASQTHANAFRPSGVITDRECKVRPVKIECHFGNRLIKADVQRVHRTEGVGDLTDLIELGRIVIPDPPSITRRIGDESKREADMLVNYCRSGASSAESRELLKRRGENFPFLGLSAAPWSPI